MAMVRLAAAGTALAGFLPLGSAQSMLHPGYEGMAMVPGNPLLAEKVTVLEPHPGGKLLLLSRHSANLSRASGACGWS